MKPEMKLESSSKPNLKSPLAFGFMVMLMAALAPSAMASSSPTTRQGSVFGDNAYNCVGEIPVSAEQKQDLENGFKQVLASVFNANYEDRLIEAKRKMPMDRMGLDEAEAVALFGYTTKDYRILNGALRLRGSDEETERDRLLMRQLQPYVDLVNLGMRKLPVYLGSVDRGTKLPPKADSAYKPENPSPVTDKAFVSASLNYSQFRNTHHLILKSKTGREVQMFSESPEEAEVLFHPGTLFKVLHREIDTSTAEVTHEIHLDELSPPACDRIP